MSKCVHIDAPESAISAIRSHWNLPLSWNEWETCRMIEHPDKSIVLHVTYHYGSMHCQYTEPVEDQELLNIFNESTKR